MMPSKPIPPRPDAALLAAHWRRTRAITAILLALWLLTGFCTIFFARELASFSLFGWPLSFYMAAQGASLVYLSLIGFYAWRMRRLDLRYRRDYERAAIEQKEPS